MANAAAIFKLSGPKQARPQARPNAYRRGYGGKGWEITRLRIFLRDNYICRGCGRVCIEKAADKNIRPHCDHIVPKPAGSEDNDNLQTLCGSCHSLKTIREGH